MNQIIQGTLNSIFNRELDLSNKRMAICEKCKLYKEHVTFGPLCNNKLYINIDTDETSDLPEKNFKKGCGCILRSKTRVINAKCPISKW
jgi:hypothetical protein